MKDGMIYTLKTVPSYYGKQITLGDVMETGVVDEEYFIPEEKLYYTDHQLRIVMKQKKDFLKSLDKHGNI